MSVCNFFFSVQIKFVYNLYDCFKVFFVLVSKKAVGGKKWPCFQTVSWAGQFIYIAGIELFF